MKSKQIILYSNKRYQGGAVLAVALVFLLVITVLGVTGMRSSNVNLMMASNEQLRIEATEKTQAIIDAVISESSNLKVTGGVGYKLCGAGDTDATCNDASMIVPTNLTSTITGEEIDFFAERKGPESTSAPALKESEASSAAFYKATFFEIQANYNGTAVRRGNSEIAQGVMVLIPDV